MMNRAPRRRASLSLLLATAVGLTAARPAAAGPATTAEVWVGSQDALQAAVDAIGLPVPVSGLTAELSKLVPSLAAADVRPNAPMGLLYAMDDVTPVGQERLAVVLPVGPAAEPKAKADAGDLVAPDGGPFVRRAGDFLVSGFDGPLVSGLDVPARTAAMRPAADASRTPLVSAWCDVAGFRTDAPKTYADRVAANRKAITAETNAARRLGTQIALAALEKLDRMSLSVDQTRDGGWTATAGLTPCRLSHHGLLRYGLPDGCCGRFDLRLPADAVMPLVRIVAPARADHPALAALAAAAFGGDAQTIGLAMVDDQPVVYCVSQRRVPADLGVDLLVVKDKAATLPPAAAADYAATTYAGADGLPVYRFALHAAADRLAGHLDVMSRGGVRYATFSPSEAHRVDALAAARPEPDPFDTIADGWVEPGRALAVFFALTDGDPDLAKVPQGKRHRLIDLLGSGRITFAGRPAGAGATFVANVPRPLLKAIVPAMQLFQD